MPAKRKIERIEYGQKVRRIRERMDLTRDAFAARLGVSSTTVKQVELGYQNLGAAARRNMEQLAETAAEGSGGMVAENPGAYRVDRPGNNARALCECIASLIGDPATRASADRVKTALNCSEEEALRILVQRHLEKEGWL